MANNNIKNTMRLAVSFSGEDTFTLLHSIQQLAPFKNECPMTVIVDDFHETEGTPDWVDKWVPNCKYEVSAYWGENQDEFLHFHRRSGIVKMNIEEYPKNASAVLAMLSPLPWTLAVFRNIHLDWYNPDIQYYASSLGNFHFSHGWGCAFKGEGHRHLVSRRWLDYGPWHLLQGANDTTLVQFHDLETDAITALEQAKLGHERMGISATGGFIYSNYIFKQEISGLYSKQDRKYRVVIFDRHISEPEMLDLCAARYCQVLGANQPIDSVAYVFIKEEEARQYLHDLWLRELECWTIINGREVQLDIDYHPLPEKPQWVKQLQAVNINLSSR